jgi:hypothetical protein
MTRSFPGGMGVGADAKSLQLRLYFALMDRCEFCQIFGVGVT